jgi:hypothetical protein
MAKLESLGIADVAPVRIADFASAGVAEASACVADVRSV